MLKLVKVLTGVIGILALSATGWAQAKPADLSVVLTHQKISTMQGKEVAEPADSAKPGEIIEYKAVYSNKGSKTLRRVEATLPIPAGTEVVQDSLNPNGAKASLDGVVYKAIPLKRLVRQPDGKQIEQLVPFAEYRFLRWSVGVLEPGKQAVYSARVRVSAEPTPTSNGAKQ